MVMVTKQEEDEPIQSGIIIQVGGDDVFATPPQQKRHHHIGRCAWYGCVSVVGADSPEGSQLDSAAATASTPLAVRRLQSTVPTSRSTRSLSVVHTDPRPAVPIAQLLSEK
jgi:hypothetical protein